MLFSQIILKQTFLKLYGIFQDIKLILHRVLDNISDTIVAVSTVNGSHCLDILFAKESDPEWLVMQRKVEVRIVEQWISEYYADLLAYKK
uniref:Uncharacterized protein n=1 Tax=Quercus lobata TaxID=97700 RepID=A0A7N2LAC9_QUELO